MTELSSSESKAVLTWERRERGAVPYGASGTRTGDLLGAITGEQGVVEHLPLDEAV
jgi:hypothetical protein